MATRVRLKQLRFERGLTVRELADASGLHPSTVSRLETGARRLRVDHVEALARGLGVAPEELLGARPAPARDGRVWDPVGPERPDGARVYRVTIPAGEPHLHSHEGHEWLYVLSGRLRLRLEGRAFDFEPGQAVEFNTWRPHSLAGPAEALAIFHPDGAPLVTSSVPVEGEGA
jgi:transcriptional regulator with XRE-family HTH domain